MTNTLASIRPDVGDTRPCPLCSRPCQVAPSDVKWPNHIAASMPNTKLTGLCWYSGHRRPWHDAKLVDETQSREYTLDEVRTAIAQLSDPHHRKIFGWLMATCEAPLVVLSEPTDCEKRELVDSLRRAATLRLEHDDKPVRSGTVQTMLTRLRRVGWSVAVHNDYRQHGRPFTFWLWTRPIPNRGLMWAIRGEAPTDHEALAAVVKQALCADCDGTGNKGIDGTVELEACLTCFGSGLGEL